MGNCVKQVSKRTDQPPNHQASTLLNARKALKHPASPPTSARKRDAPTAIISEQHKTPEERTDIKETLLSHSVFSSLTHKHLDLVIDEMKHYSLGPHETVVTQGQPGNVFFVVASGTLEIIINGKTKGYLTKNHSFGELALIDGSLRTATIRTMDRVALWGINRDRFRLAVQSVIENKSEENRNFINTHPKLKHLPEPQRVRLLALSVTLEYSDGQAIVKEGDPANLFYFIKEGAVKCMRKGVEIRQLGVGELFGEQAFLQNTVRTATVTAIGKTQLLSIGRESLVSALGDHFNEIIYTNSVRIALEKSLVLGRLTKNQIDTITERMEVSTYHTGQVVIPRGQPRGSRVWVLVKGSVTAAVQDKDYFVFCTIGDHDLLQDPGEVYTEDLVASSDTDVAELSREDLEFCLGGSLADRLQWNESLKLLAQVNLFVGLPTSVTEKILNAIIVQEFDAQDEVFAQYSPPVAFYIVKEGEIDIVRNNEVIRTIRQFGSFGERAILFNTLRSASAVACRRTVLWMLPRVRFLGLIEKPIMAQLLKRIMLQNDEIELSQLLYLRSLGKGRLGNVMLVAHESSESVYALKSVHRAKVVQHKAYPRLKAERSALLRVDHPFIVKLVKTFKDSPRVYLLYEYVKGQNLGLCLESLGRLNDSQTQFYTACIVLALKHLHDRSILYRGLRPDKMMVDAQGYIKIIDLELATITNGRTYTVVGSPQYIPPEMIVGHGYSFPADLWALGVMIYEMACGALPFNSKDPFKVYNQVLSQKVQYPASINPHMRAKPIIELLLRKNPEKRGNCESLQKHPWLAGIDWDKLQMKQISPPVLPSVPQSELDTHRAMKTITSLFAIIEKEEAQDLAAVPTEEWPTPRDMTWDKEF